MSVTRARGVDVNWELVGEGRPVVVLLHGWGGCIASMAPIREALRADHAVLSIDLPGFGESTAPPDVWGSEEYAACIGDVLRDVAQGRVLAVIGHSFGGKIAAYLAVGQPVPIGALVLAGTPGVRLPLSPEARRRIASVKRMKRVARLLPGPLRRSIERSLVSRGSEDYRNAGELRPILVRVVNEDLSPLLPNIPVPTLLLFGANDTATPPEIGRRMEGLIPGSGLVVLERSGHFPYLDEPAAFTRITKSFLESMGRAS